MDIIERIKRKIIEGVVVVEELPEETGEEVAAWRKSICDKCEKRSPKNICTVCVCILDIKQKTYRNRNFDNLETEITHCPLGRWDDAEIAKFYRLKKIEKK